MSKQQVEHTAVSYDSDFFEWCLETAELLRQRRFEDVDVEHLAKEIEDMGKRDRREARSRMTVLLAHLLKWEFQPELRAKSTWRPTIVEQRSELSLLLKDSPSLRRAAEDYVTEAYEAALELAAAETRIPAKHFPAPYPYTFAEFMRHDFFPEKTE